MDSDRNYIRIATEEAFATKEMYKLYQREIDRNPPDEPGFMRLWGFFLVSKDPYPLNVRERLLDLGERRINDMNESGIDRQVIFLTAPGVQIFDADTANALAISTNDELDAACKQHPDRYTPLCAVAPQDPAAAAKELERCVKQLGMKGAVVNSHTKGEYLDDPRFWEIFEAADALNVPVYIHPRTPSPAMLQPMAEVGVEAAMYGFGVETGLHLLRIIISGAFDRFPNLRIIVGHLGEALPFWLYRIDHMHGAAVKSGRHPRIKPLQKKPSDYMRENIYITSSGMPWAPAIKFTQDVLGMDRVMYAMDYPYQFIPAEVTMSDNVEISDTDKLKFFQTNAEKVFSI